MKKVTLKDIANELGVTIGTVSHVMNGIDDISEETKVKVLDTAKKMGYIANTAAVSLRSGKTNTIAVIAPDISNPHLAHQVKLIEDKLKSKKYSVIILNTNEDEEEEYNAIVTAASKQVDGIMLCPAMHSTKNIEFLNNIGIPYILIGRFFQDFNTDYVCADDIKGGYLAGKYLLENGYKNPLYIGAYKYVESSTNRFCGLKKAFEENNLPLSDSRFIEISPKVDNVKDILKTLKNESVTFDSIVVFSDLLAFEILHYIKKDYKNLPVIGFDAINTHLHLPFHNISIGMKSGGWATKAASVLLKKINGANDEFREIIDVELFEFNK